MNDGDEFGFEQCCLDHDDAGGFNPWRAQMAHVTSAVPMAPSTRESIACATEAAGAADANTRTAAASTYSRTSTAMTDNTVPDRDAMSAGGGFPSIAESVAMGAMQNRRGDMTGYGRGRFRKGEGKPKDWTKWEKEHQAAELEALETRRRATLGETSRIATTIPSVPSAFTPVIQRHLIAPLIATTSIPLPAATGVSLSVGAEIQGVAKADEDVQDRFSTWEE
jgi:hypothetical protein